jgi:ferrochelatase
MGAGLQEALGEAYVVVPAMRYGNPSIAQAIEHMAELGVEHLVVFPLYPQYAQSSTETSILESKRIAARVLPSATVDVVPPFFDDEEVIKAYAAQGRKILDEFQPDHVLFSFHGLPERHIFKSDNSRQHCLKSEHCCAQMVAANSRCYRAQSFQSARLIAAELSLAQSQWSTSFQSRLGRSKWIEPYTDVLLDELPKRGIKRTAVFCPAFVSDCLETLEEIGIRAKAQFIEAGGEDLRLVPSLNASPQWVNAAANLVRQSAGSAQ